MKINIAINSATFCNFDKGKHLHEIALDIRYSVINENPQKTKKYRIVIYIPETLFNSGEIETQKKIAYNFAKEKIKETVLTTPIPTYKEIEILDISIFKKNSLILTNIFLPETIEVSKI